MSLLIVFVHGWSVTNVDTYGELPVRIRNEAASKGIAIEIKEIFLGRYISFHDEVRVADISRAFRQAVSDELSDLLKDGSRFACITHSTGGPVIRDWWYRYYVRHGEQCPMSHLVMLAPANFGSALAQLGKSRLGRIKSWFDGVEPGQGVLNWLELGSAEAWELNSDWILGADDAIDHNGVFPFVVTGESIDRSLYDHLNSYTGEIGSDGVVRVAAANLEASYIRLEQPFPAIADGVFSTADFNPSGFKKSPSAPLRVVSGKSHSGENMGIMKSVKKDTSDENRSETVSAIFDCLSVENKADYEKVYKKFQAETNKVQESQRIETEKQLFSGDRYFIHDRFSMVIFKVVDTEGYPVADFDLILTAGKENNPNLLPEGFFADRQRNTRSPATITYFFNYDIMNGTPEIKNGKGEVIRKAIEGISSLGLKINPRPDKGFVRYVPCEIKASKDLFNKVLTPNSTTLIEICLQRMVYKEVFSLEKLPESGMPSKKDGDFSNLEPGENIVK
ncbi:MAG: phospholipase [Bacteroidota bacterium]